MGTSTSSTGPKSGVPFDPPWLDQINGDPSSGEDHGNNSSIPPESEIDKNPNETGMLPVQIAPPARFGGARRALGSFFRNGGGRETFSKAAGHYSKKGMGGAGGVASRMRHSTRTASNLAQFLGTASSGTDNATTRWVEAISERNLSSSEIIDEIIRHVAPSGGSRDEESCSNSMAQAMSEFLERNDDADLLGLEAADIREITELFIANEAYVRLMNDIGQISESVDLSPVEAVKLGEEMHEYLVADISVQIEKAWQENPNPTQVQLEQLLHNAVKGTFEIYEDGI